MSKEQASTAGSLPDRLRKLRRHQAHGHRAPHKPLLLLYALARLREGRTELPFAEVEPALEPLLRQYGHPGTRAEPKDPFARLATDGIWEVRLDHGQSPFTGTDHVSRVKLLEHQARAGFSAEALAELRAHPNAIDQAARILLDANFPPSLHENIAEAVGLPLGEATPDPSRKRDPRFRELVLRAYRRRCAFCGFQLFHGNAAVGLDGAHVRWWAEGGPDDVSNGLALCALHHKLFDLGVITADLGYRLRVDPDVAGPSGEALAERLEGREVLAPQQSEEVVRQEHLAWHHREVFRGHISRAGGKRPNRDA